MAGPACLRADEVNVIDVMAHPVPHEAQPGEGLLDQPALCRSVASQYTVVCLRVIAQQRAVDDRDPPHRLTDHRVRTRPVPRTDPDKPPCRFTHRGDGPVERAHPGRPVARILAVPRDTAASRAEPGVLPARREHGAALLTVPGISHQAMLRVTCTPGTKPPCPHGKNAAPQAK